MGGGFVIDFVGLEIIPRRDSRFRRKWGWLPLFAAVAARLNTKKLTADTVATVLRALHRNRLCECIKCTWTGETQLLESLGLLSR